MELESSRVHGAHEARPKTWEELTDEEIVEAVRFACEGDPLRVARGATHVLAALSAPRAEQWPEQPVPRNAQLGLGLIPSYGEGSASSAKVAARLRKLAKAGLIEPVEMVNPRGGRAPSGFRPKGGA